MITSPTTDVLVRDCCRELTEEILPALQDDTLRLRLIMTVTVLENAAVRAASEIAWLREETNALLAFSRDVRAAFEDGALVASLTAVEEGPRESLQLADVVQVYERACRAFHDALAVVQRAEAADLIARAARLLRARVDTEKTVMASYAVVGR